MARILLNNNDGLNSKDYFKVSQIDNNIECIDHQERWQVFYAVEDNIKNTGRRVIFVYKLIIILVFVDSNKCKWIIVVGSRSSQIC